MMARAETALGRFASQAIRKNAKTTSIGSANTLRGEHVKTARQHVAMRTRRRPELASDRHAEHGTHP